MGTEHFNSLILQATQHQQDERPGSVITDDGGSDFTTNLYVSVMNQTIRKFVKTAYAKLKLDPFTEEFPEYVELVESVVNISYDLDRAMLDVISVGVKDGAPATFVPPKRYQIIKSGYDLEDKVTLAAPAWTSFDRKIFILEPHTLGPWEILIVWGHKDVILNPASKPLFDVEFLVIRSPVTTS